MAALGQVYCCMASVVDMAAGGYDFQCGVTVSIGMGLVGCSIRLGGFGTRFHERERVLETCGRIVTPATYGV